MEKQTLDQIKEKFVQNNIDKGNYVKLSTIISIGDVLRVSGYGSLEENGFEHGFLYLKEGSGINHHVHLNNVELYRLIKGDQKTRDIICLLGDFHSIDKVKCDTIIEYFKVNKKIYPYVNNYGTLNGLLQTCMEVTYNQLNEFLFNIVNDIEDDNLELQNIIKDIYFNYENEKPKTKKLS